MNYRNQREDRDLFSMLGHQAKATSTKKGINKLNEVIDWQLLCSDLESILGYDKRDRKKGDCPPFDPVLMLKVLVLQKFHGHSDDETEFQINDRFSFLQFLGLKAGMSSRTPRRSWISSNCWRNTTVAADVNCSNILAGC